MTKVEGWPLVLPDDDGIRPAGGPNTCYYCHRDVGEEHARNCLTVTKVVRYAVMLRDVEIGTFTMYEPHSWSPMDCEHRRNLSSWCKDNVLDVIRWTSKNGWTEVRESGEAGGCACDFLDYRFKDVEDWGPFVELRAARTQTEG